MAVFSKLTSIHGRVVENFWKLIIPKVLDHLFQLLTNLIYCQSKTFFRNYIRNHPYFQSIQIIDDSGKLDRVWLNEFEKYYRFSAEFYFYFMTMNVDTNPFPYIEQFKIIGQFAQLNSLPNFSQSYKILLDGLVESKQSQHEWHIMYIMEHFVHISVKQNQSVVNICKLRICELMLDLNPYYRQSLKEKYRAAKSLQDKEKVYAFQSHFFV